MSAKYISNVLFNNTLDKSSYLNDLPVIKYFKEFERLDFYADVTFLLAKMELVNPPCSKLSR